MYASRPIYISVFTFIPWEADSYIPGLWIQGWKTYKDLWRYINVLELQYHDISLFFFLYFLEIFKIFLSSLSWIF
jgi:hypothetical protein